MEKEKRSYFFVVGPAVFLFLFFWQNVKYGGSVYGLFMYSSQFYWLFMCYLDAALHAASS